MGGNRKDRYKYLSFCFDVLGVTTTSLCILDFMTCEWPCDHPMVYKGFFHLFISFIYLFYFYFLWR